MNAVRFRSILFDGEPQAPVGETAAEPEFFGDLKLDKVVAAIVAGYDEYDLVPFFYAPLHEVAAVEYRHEVLRDLERAAVREPVEEFGRKMRRMRMHLALVDKLRYHYEKQRWFLDAVHGYCRAVARLADRLSQVDLGSRGMRAFRDHLGGYADSTGFHTLVSDTCGLREELAKVRYCVQIRGARVTVRRYAGEADYSTDVEKTFARFKQGSVKDYTVMFRDEGGMNHVEAQVLGCVARLYPETFRILDDYCERHREYLDETIGRFSREVQFYLACLDFVRRISAAGLTFCYPEVSTRSREIVAENAFDVALATTLVPERKPVVCNSFELRGKERVIVVTGPNQGGKMTFARMFGQLPYLAGLGLPVPASRARLFLPDRVFSHFEREESLATLRGKLDDELVRIHGILERATGNSVIVMNESFASTTLNDARFIGTRMLRRILRLGALAVYVTFVDELASLDQAVVSMVGAIVPGDPARRTYTITRRPADGLAYAAVIAARYGLTDAALRRRIAR